VIAGATTTPVDTGGLPFIKEWGRQSGPRWSPDGSKIAFVSDRNDHAFVAVYDVRTRTVSYVSPSVVRRSRAREESAIRPGRRLVVVEAAAAVPGSADVAAVGPSRIRHRRAGRSRGCSAPRSAVDMRSR
jgi:hypothetical protein